MNKIWNDIPSLHNAYLDGKTTPSEVVGWYLDRIDKYNSLLNCYLTVTGDEAISLAKIQDRELQANPKIIKSKPLFGVPLSVKDIYMTEGIKTTAGSQVLENYVAQYSATVMKKYLDAGAILLGKTNLDAWAHGSSGENSDFGPTKNPWATDYVPGGSSSGSAAALSADLTLISAGTDTGGSIRCPASFCSVTGLKPTYGRVSRYGIIAMASSLDSIGHFAHTASDCAKILEVTAGVDPRDATSSDQSVDNYSDFRLDNLKGLKIGIPKEYLRLGSTMTSGMDKLVETKVEGALEKLTELGAEIIPISLPHTPEALAAYYVIQPAEVSSNLARFDGIRYGQPRQFFGSEAKRRIMLGTFTLSAGYYEAYYNTAQKLRTLLIQDFDQAFQQVNLIASPVMPHLPFKIGEKVNDPLSLYLEDVLSVPMNLAGLPAISVPCGFSSNRLPIGFQLVGRQFSEKLIFEVANLYQQVTDWHLHQPIL